MKYLNTRYPSLFDASQNCSTDATNGIIVAGADFSSCYCTKEINTIITTTSIYLKFLYQSTGNISSGLILNLRVVNSGPNLIMYSSSTQLKFTNANGTFSWTVDVPSKGVSYNGRNYHQREVLIHFDTVQNIMELYSDGIYYGSTACGNNGENIRQFLIGSLNSGFYVNFANIIVSDSAILPTESVTEVTPTITSTDWTVASGTATTDVVGGAMVLTAPSGSIDETRRSVTGYGVAFFNASSSATINALNVAQGTSTQQVLLPSSGDIETANAFTVSQLSGISATVTSAYVS